MEIDIMSIKEFFSSEEYAAIPEYERKHLISLRQNYEALKKCGLEVNPPDFMRRKRTKATASYQPPLIESSDDSDDEWTPACENRKKSKNSFVPRFFAPRQKQTAKVRQEQSTPRERKKPDATKYPLIKPSAGPQCARYPLRNKQLVKFMSLAVPDEDDFLYCEDCNIEYPGDCPAHGPLVLVEDKEVSSMMKNDNPNYCYLTLPDGLEIKPSKIDGAGLGVFASCHFSTRTRFGPYRGIKERNEDVAHNSGYCWQVHQDGRPSHFVDAKDPCNSNWMRFVNCARSEDEQCLTAYQHEGEIFYRAHQEIPPGTELLVYYGDSYAEELKIPMQKVGSNRRPSLNKLNDDIFPCNVCRLAFSSSIFLERHLHRLHSDEYWKRKRKTRTAMDFSADCFSQGFKEDDSSQVVPLRDSCPKGVPTSCESSSEPSDCNSTIQTHSTEASSDTKHQKSVSGAKPYKCSVCSKAFSESGSLQKHMRIHTGEKPYKCSVCSQAFSLSGHLQGHMRIHTGEKPYKCSVCSQAFSVSGSLHTHMRIHTGEKPYKCSVCSQAFSLSCNLQGHMRIHTGEKPYKCSVCSQAFSLSCNLQTHMRIHSGEKPYKCSVCCQAFSQSCNLQGHMRIHTGEKPYKCSVCSQAFSLSGHLQGHMRIHTGEKPYKCSVCSKAFSQSGDLQKHMRIHTGEKPYKCSVCSQAFSRSGSLQGHMRIHTGEKPYKCSVCSQAFSDCRSMKKHERKH